MKNFGIENPILENRQEEINDPEHVLYNMEDKMAELRKLMISYETASDETKQAIKNSIDAGIEDLKAIGNSKMTEEQQAQRIKFLEELRGMQEKTS